MAADTPEDILREILLRNASDPMADLRSKATTTRSSSQVCRSWREIALRCLEIWAQIIDYEYDSPRWMEELVRRSSPAPLTIAGGSGSPIFWTERKHHQDAEARIREDLLLKNTERWRYLSVCGLPETQFAARMELIDYLLQPAPYIQALKLGAGDLSWEYFDLKGSIFAGHAPSLRSLDLSDVRIDFNSLHTIGGQLEEFLLYWDDDDFHEDRQLFLDWMRFLRVTPRLRYLFFHHNVTRFEESIRMQPGFIALEKLQTICLEIPDTSVCKAVMDKLTIPDKCGFTIYCTSPQSSRGQSDAVDLIRSRVQSWSHNPNAGRVLYAQLGLNKPYSSFSNFELASDTYSLNHSTWTYRKEFDAVVRGGICPADPPIVIWTGTGSHHYFLSQLSAFETSFPATTHLRLPMVRWHSLDSDEEQTLISSLSKFNNLKSLEIPKRSCIALLPILMRPPSGPVLLPSLQLIRFLRFKEQRGSILADHTLTCIKHFLKWRSDQHHPISTIDLGECVNDEFIDRSSFEWLSRMVNVLPKSIMEG